MKGTFQLGEVGEYIPQNVQENDFLNRRLESDTYGIYYSVKFEGDAETFLLQAKRAPVEGQPEWGMIEQSKSGKSLRFKRVKREDSAPSGSSQPENKFQRDVTSIPLDVWRTLVGIQGVPTNPTEFMEFFLTVQQHANELLLMIDNVRSGSLSAVPTPSDAIKEPRPTAATASLGDTYRQKRGVANEPELTDEDYQGSVENG